MKYQCLACKAADNCELSWKDQTEEYMNCTEFKAPPRTNADRIRNMTDEELAKWFCSMCNFGDFCPYQDDYDTNGSCILKWMKEEVKDV